MIQQRGNVQFALLGDDEEVGHLAQRRVLQADDRAILDLRMTNDDFLDLRGCNILATADDQLLDAARDRQ